MESYAVWLFYVWLFSLSIMVSMSIHVPEVSVFRFFLSVLKM